MHMSRGCVFVFFKQKTAYEMRISDWSSDVCSSDLSFASSERWRITERVERLHKLGFDIEELAIKTDETGTQVRIQPKVVDAGHHQRRLLRQIGRASGRESVCQYV